MVFISASPEQWRDLPPLWMDEKVGVDLDSDFYLAGGGSVGHSGPVTVPAYLEGLL